MRKKHKRPLVLSFALVWLCAVLLVTIVHGNPVAAVKRAVTDARTARESAEAVRMGMQLSGSSSSEDDAPPNEAKTHGAAISSSQSSAVGRSSNGEYVPQSDAPDQPSIEIPASGNEQLTLLTESAMNGNAEAQFTMGEVSVATKSADATIMAYAWYALAAKQGHGEAAQKAEGVRQTLSPDDLAQAETRLAQLQKTVESRREPESVIRARDDKRRADIVSIRNALLIHKIRHGAYPAGLPDDHSLSICLHGADCSNGADLSVLVTDGSLAEIPTDPKAEQGTTGYILRGYEGEFFVIAPNMERSVTTQATTRN